MNIFCPLHPKQVLGKAPKHSCLRCLELYFKFRPPRAPIIHTRIKESKKIYSRKKKIRFD